MPLTLPSPEQLRAWIRTLRQRRREETLGLLATLLMAGAALVGTDQLPQVLKPLLARTHAALGLVAIALVFYGWLIVRLWRQALPRRRDVVIRPTALKGPRAFGPQDGELFLRLGRDRELSELLACVLDDQIGLVVLMGESGAGKTSLLRSGLTHLLEQVQVPPIPCLYWEARPTEPQAGLLHVVEEKLKDPVAFTWASLVSRLDEARRVVLLDQFEQLDPTVAEHFPVFDLLCQVGLRRPPFRTTWIVSFRREFDPVWRDFEIAHPQLRNRMVSLKRFAPDRAKEVLATLAETVDLTLDEALLDDLVSAAAEKTGVSPVDLGIAILVLDELARSQRRSSLSLADYRFAGGSESLLASYFLDRLNDLTEEDRRALLKALLLLVDLPNDQRVAEGRSIAVLAAEASRTLPRMTSDLDDLVEARLLEKVGPDRYRLQHERLIAPLRQLTSQILAEADRARLLLTDSLGRWLRHPRPSGLLAGADLRLILQHRIPLLVGHAEAAEFVRQSRIRRSWRRAATAAAIGLALVGVFYAQHRLRIAKDQSLLLGSGLPLDLADHQGQLRSLHLSSTSLNNLAWLRAPLTELEFSAQSMREIPPLPSTLERLTIHGGGPTLLDNLPSLPRLQELNLEGGTWLKKLPSLQDRFPRLRKLTFDLVADAPSNALAPLSSLTALEDLTVITGATAWNGMSLPSLGRLKKLKLFGAMAFSFPPGGLPRLEELAITKGFDMFEGNSLSGLECPSAEQISPRLKVLVLHARLDRLPDLSCFSRLEDVRLGPGGVYRENDESPRAQVSSIPALVRPLVTASFFACRPSLDSELQGLSRLTDLTLQINDACGSHTLPQGLEHLRLEIQGSTLPKLLWENVSRLPRLRELSVVQAGEARGSVLFSTPGLPYLKILTLNADLASLVSLKAYPALEELHLLFVAVAGVPLSLKGLPALQELRVLDVFGEGFLDLHQLPRLPRLKILGLRGDSVKSLDGLPSTVTELYL